MDRQVFDNVLSANKPTIDQIKRLAHDTHESVNQHYDKVYPYSVHLDAVVAEVLKYAAQVCQSADDVVPIVFGAYFHDSMEDARLTYNNVKNIAIGLMSETQAHMAAEIVYALTNEKGRNRAERANDKYYAGIRTTPYAPLCKVADRLANVSYSANGQSHKPTMLQTYASENPHFIASVVDNRNADPRMHVPAEMVKALEYLLKN